MGYENYVIGSKTGDNKQAGNRQKISASSQKGRISGNQKASYYSPQNSSNHTPGGPDETGDSGIKVQAKRQKKLVRVGASYDDRSIKAAANARGM